MEADSDAPPSTASPAAPVTPGAEPKPLRKASGGRSSLFKWMYRAQLRRAMYRPSLEAERVNSGDARSSCADEGEERASGDGAEAAPNTPQGGRGALIA